MITKKIQFEGGLGERLAGALDMPEAGDPEIKGYALFAHCFTCSKNLKAVTHISEALTDHGFGVLRFDFTGLGGSEGDFADTNFTSNIQDLVAAAGWLGEHREAPRVLIGHSLGGAAALRATTEINSVAAVATIGAPYEPAHVSHLIGDKLEEIETRGEAMVRFGYREMRVRRQFLDDLEQNRRPERHISRLGRALLILHAPLDDTVDIDNAAQIYAAARHPKSFISLDGADHLLSNEEDSTFAGAMIAIWATRYL